jgi:hypothetical protein
MANSIEYAKRFMPIIDGIYNRHFWRRGLLCGYGRQE